MLRNEENREYERNEEVLKVGWKLSRCSGPKTKPLQTAFPTERWYLNMIIIAAIFSMIKAFKQFTVFFLIPYCSRILSDTEVLIIYPIFP